MLKILPRSNGLHTVLGAIRRLADEIIDLNPSFRLIDDAPFGYASAARGLKRILPPEMALTIQHRARRQKLPKAPAIQGLLKRAYLLKTRLTGESGMTRSKLAQQLALDPSRITQILNLLNLAPEIQMYIRALQPIKDHSAIGDEDWMQLARIPDHELQIREFDRLQRALM